MGFTLLALSGTSLKITNCFSSCWFSFRMDATVPHLISYLNTPVEVVGCGPDGHEVLFGEPELVPLLHQLVGPAHQRELVQVVEVTTFAPNSQPWVKKYLRPG